MNKAWIYVLFSISLVLLILPISLVYGATAPDKPTNLLADDVSPTKIDLSWKAPTNDGGSPITGYKIEYKKLPNTDYLVLVGNNQNTIYSHTDLQTGSTYIYRVSAINAIGESEYSTEALAKPTSSSTPPQNIPPNPPTELVADDVSPTKVDLTWKAPAANNGPAVSGYKIEFKSGSASFSTLLNHTTNTSYSHTGATTGTAYSYRVFAVNSVGLSDSSNIAIATPTQSSTAEQSIPPNSPVNLQVYPVSPTELSLTWKAPAPNNGPPVTGYKIEFKKGSENYQTLIENNGLNTSYNHKDLSTGSTYTYRVYAINEAGVSGASNTASEKPQHTQKPQLTAKDISPTQIELSWIPPSQTFGMSIGGFVIQERIAVDTYETIGETGGKITKFTVTNLETDKTYTFVVYARYSLGSSDLSNEASATPNKDSKPTVVAPVVNISSPPLELSATAVKNEIKLSWTAPTNDGNSAIKGYKIESRTNSTFTVLVADTKSTTTSYTHSQLTPNTKYFYRVSAINGAGTSNPSNEASATAQAVLEIKPLGKFTINEEQSLRFTVSVVGTTLSGIEFSLDKNPPTGASIDSAGRFIWIPTKSQGASTYDFDIVAKKDNMVAREGVTITVNDVPDPTPTPTPQPTPTPTPQPEPEPEPKEKGIAPFVDPTKDPQYYIDRYNNEKNYKEWFEKNYPDLTIYEAVGLENPPPPKELAPFVDPNEDPQYYINRYNNEKSYKEWFDKNYPDITIYEAVGLPEPPKGVCDVGTKLVDGVCTAIESPSKKGGGCLIATATFGTELAPQVQQLREIRDNTLLETESGSSFMTSFNTFYYSFSPTIADWERESPAFRELVKISITPMLASLSLLNFVDIDSEQEMLGYGIGVIMLNVGMYFIAPAFGIMKLKRFFYN